MVLRKSTNDGVSWTQYKPTALESYAYAVLPHPTNDAVIYLGGYLVQSDGSYPPAIFKTTDRGVSWNRSGASVFTQSWEEIRVLECGKSNPNKVYAGSSYGLYISTDAGSSWSHPLMNVSVNCMLIDPANENNIFVGTYTGVESSTDGGKTWTTMNDNLTTLMVESLDFDAVNRVLYAGTQYGGVFHRSIGIANAVEKDLVPDRIELYQNYPNPFNPKTVIRFTVPVQTSYRLTVHNLLGEEIAILLDATLPAGSHAVQFDAQSLSSGTYFYRLQGGGSILTRKMTILK